MTKTVLILGPASIGKTTLIRTLAGEHPDHAWHLVQLESHEQESQVTARDGKAAGWASQWHVRYRREDVLAALPALLGRIEDEAKGRPTVIALTAPPDSLLRQAYAYDLRVFVMPPIDDPATMFRDSDEARKALQQILRDSSAFTAEVLDLTEGIDDVDAASQTILPSPGVAVEMNQSQVETFLGQPLGLELAIRVHLQTDFSAVADANIILLNTSAGPCCENDAGWRRLLALLGRLHKGTGPLTYACDLSDPEDPCFVRVRRRMAEALCKV